MMTISTVGRITKDFELKTGEKSGCIYANFSLVVNEMHGGKPKATFFECTVFGPEAERLIKAKAKKGSLLQVTGKFGTSEFTRQSGELGYSLRITVLAWSYIPGTGGQKDANGGNGNNGSNGTDGGNAQVPEQYPEAQPPGGPDSSFIDTINLDDEDSAF